MTMPTKPQRHGRPCVSRQQRGFSPLLVRPSGLGVAFGVCVAWGLAGPACAEPFLPGSDTVVLEQLPTAKDPKIAQLRRMHAALARQPDNMNLAVAVARGEVEQARARFDPRFNGYAQAALAPWWGQPDPPVPVRLLRALIHQSNHNFTAALTDLDALVAANADDRQALLTRAVVHQVRGEYAQAGADCAAVTQAGAALAGGICAAGLHGLGRDVAAAYGELQQTTTDAGRAIPPELQLWAQTLLAEMAARLDDPAAADQHFAAALAIAPQDGYLLGAYADFLLDTGREAEVIPLLTGFTLIDPLLLRLAIAEHRLGLAEADRHIRDLAERFAASTARGETVHRREEARFTLQLLGQPEAALRLALANFDVQREPADLRVLLECAAAADAPAQAQPALAWLRDTGLDDPALRRLAASLSRPAAPS